MRLFIYIFLLFSITLQAKTGYNQALSNWHLNKIYHKVKQESDIAPYALQEAFYYYKQNRYNKKLSNHYLAIADYTKISKQKRLYIIDLRKGLVHRYMVAHGKKSGAKGGRVWRASNRLNSHMTPRGFFKVGSKEGITSQKKYNYLPIQGLELDNRKVGLPTYKGGRDVIVHTAEYVNREGRSRGCFAIRPQDRWNVFPKLKEALLYSYTGR